MIAEGNYTIKAIDASLIMSRGQPAIRVTCKLKDQTEQLKWTAVLDAQLLKYARHGLMAMGWDGKDITEAPKQIVGGRATTANVKHMTSRNTGEVFAVFRDVGGEIGAEAMPQDEINRINAMLRGEEPEPSDLPF